MAAADVDSMPIFIRRIPTCLSLQQNSETYQQPCKSKGHSLECIPQPDAAVADARGACIPKYTFPALDCKLQAPKKRVRSFGDLHQVVVPHMDDISEDCFGCARLLFIPAVCHIMHARMQDELNHAAMHISD